MTPWTHLPNARHIDRILASLQANPDAWDTITTREQPSILPDEYHAYDATWDLAADAIIMASRAPAWVVARNQAKWWAREAVLALLAWDDCGYLLDEKPEHVQMLSLLGIPAAALLWPACYVLSKENPVA